MWDLPHQPTEPNSAVIHTPHPPVYPRLVLPSEEAYKSDIYVICPLSNELDVLFNLVMIFLNADCFLALLL
jgi:hypothetical protein